MKNDKKTRKGNSISKQKIYEAESILACFLMCFGLSRILPFKYLLITAIGIGLYGRALTKQSLEKAREIIVDPQGDSNPDRGR